VEAEAPTSADICVGSSNSCFLLSSWPSRHGMVQGGLASSWLGRLAMRPGLCRPDQARPQHQIFVLDAFIYSAPQLLHPPTHRSIPCSVFGPYRRFCGLSCMPAVLHHPIVADAAFRLESKNLWQPRRTWRAQVVVLASRRFPRKSSVVLRKIIPLPNTHSRLRY